MGNTTTTVNPPDYQLPYLRQALEQAQQQYQGGGPKQYPGQTVVPFASQTEQALAGTQQRALAGSPVTAAAQQYATKSLNGDFIGSNPYLDRMFNRAATATQNQTASEFARAGRNVGASEPIRSQQLGDLATSIYGGAYDADRSRQQQTIPFANELANQDYTDLGQLQNVGSTVQNLGQSYVNDAANRYDYQQNQPGNNLDDYLKRIQGNIGTQTSTSTPHNTAAGALGGALAGSQIGSGIGSGYGGWGAAIGGILGAFG